MSPNTREATLESLTQAIAYYEAHGGCETEFLENLKKERKKLLNLILKV